MALKKKDKKEEVTETAITTEDVPAETEETFNADTQSLQKAVHIVSKTFN